MTADINPNAVQAPRRGAGRCVTGPRVRLVVGLLVGVMGGLLTGCGGGGSAGDPSVLAGEGTSGPVWTQGVFAASSIYANQCEVVRTGVDSEGNAYPDEPGSILEEQFFLRSWTNETYLWNTEVVDQDPADFQTTLDYFAVLKTDAVTASGAPKDNFHFSQSTEEYLEARNSAPRSGYGYRLAVLSNTPPRDYRIVYTEPNSPASDSPTGTPNFVRGTQILQVDGVDLVNGGATDAEIDTLNDGLFPAAAGETHTFTVRDPGAAMDRVVTITSADVTSTAVNRTELIDTDTGRVGYILFNTFNTLDAEQQIANAMSDMADQNVTDLVLDLRYNSGGYLAIAAQLGYMVGGDQTVGQVFENLVFNNAPSTVNPVTGGANSPIDFITTGVGFSLANGVPLSTLNLDRVYILSTDSTCSASESLLNGLRGVDVEVVLIGDTTCGKPYGFYAQSNCGQTYFSIQFQGVNAKGFGDYAQGFTPENAAGSSGVSVTGCAISDDLSTELGDPAEALLAAALQYRLNGSCPTNAPMTVSSPADQFAQSVAGRALSTAALKTTDMSVGEQLLSTNRRMDGLD